MKLFGENMIPDFRQFGAHFGVACVGEFMKLWVQVLFAFSSVVSRGHLN